MAKRNDESLEKMNYLKSDLATAQFASKGHLGEASNAIAPIIEAFENASVSYLPKRLGKTFRIQLETELAQLNKAGLKRVIRITEPQLHSKQSNGNLGFTRWVDASREWRECEILATVLEQYVDVKTGECIIENYDEKALLTVRQSRHIRASEQKKSKNKDVYIREHYLCPSCGAALEHIADQTNCSFCGAYITFHFFDWQIDGFYLDIHKQCLLNSMKAAAVDAASSAAVAGVRGAVKVAEILAGAWDEKDAQARRMGRLDKNTEHNNYLGGILTVVALIAMVLAFVFLSLPFYVKIAIGVLLAFLIAWGVIKCFKATDQSRKKKKIVRYSDGYLRSCVYNEIWNDVEKDRLMDFSIDEICIKKVDNTERTTTVELVAEVIKKYISDGTRIEVTAETVPMKLSRARYPERMKAKGNTMAEKDCPSCGANFEPDSQHCCAYCGYGLKMENFVWRQTE